jgi:hypothetical protein
LLRLEMTRESGAVDFEMAGKPCEVRSLPFRNCKDERGRYEAIIAALAHKRHRRAFEPGCSIGLLTERLSTLCDFVEAIDFSPTAIGQAQKRCSHLRNVDIFCASISERMPVTGFDLIVLSEIGYYFAPDEWMSVSMALIDPMPKGGTLLAAHWLGDSRDHCIGGDEVHEILLSLGTTRTFRTS